MSGILRWSALAGLAALVAGRRVASASVAARRASTEDSWSVIAGPSGPGVWLIGLATPRSRMPSCRRAPRASHDESDAERLGWRHLTIDADLNVPVTVTYLATDSGETFEQIGLLRFNGSVRGGSAPEPSPDIGWEPS